MKDFLTRRKLLTGGAITLGGLALTGCDALSASPGFRNFLSAGESLTMSAQRALMFGQPLAQSLHQLVEAAKTFDRSAFLGRKVAFGQLFQPVARQVQRVENLLRRHRLEPRKSAGEGAVGARQVRDLAERQGGIQPAPAFQRRVQQDPGGQSGLDADVGAVVTGVRDSGLRGTGSGAGLVSHATAARGGAAPLVGPAAQTTTCVPSSITRFGGSRK